MAGIPTESPRVLRESLREPRRTSAACSEGSLFRGRIGTVDSGFLRQRQLGARLLGCCGDLPVFNRGVRAQRGRRKESSEVGPIVLKRGLGSAKCRSSPPLTNRLFVGRASVASMKVPRL